MVEQTVDFDGDIDEQQDGSIDDSDNDEELSFHHQVSSVFRDRDWNELTELIDRMDAGPMSEQARQVAQQHKQTVLSKRRQLVNENLVMRASYKDHSFHMYPASEFEQKSSAYLQQKSETYRLVQTIDAINPVASQHCLADTVRRVETTLKELLCCKLITDPHYLVMHPNRMQVQMNYLYFVPNTHRVCIYSIDSNNNSTQPV
jgi:hypothetical protein